MPTQAYATLCPGCFADKGNGTVCPHCGHDEGVALGTLVLPPRTVLNRQYLIGATLGKLGGFGVTYLAWDLQLRTAVAIKEYLPRDLAGRASDRLTVIAHSREDQMLFQQGLQLFLMEARTLAQFDHENIVRVRNVLEENGTAYLVMNFYEGDTLAAHLEKKGGRLPEKIALAIVLPVLDGLREVHAKGFLHRDIKPQNIYLTKAGTPILLDFGSARMVMGERTRSMTVLMTPGYAPFEQYHRQGQQGPWTDIYACSATLYHLLTGVIPIESTARAECDTLPPPTALYPGISPSISSSVMQALSMNREARPASAAEFAASLRQALHSSAPPNPAKPPAPAEPISSPPPPSPTTQAPPETQAQPLSPYYKAALGKGNPLYYLPRFAAFQKNRKNLWKPSWNWAGCWFNALWLMYRRVFGLGVLIFSVPPGVLWLTGNYWATLGSGVLLSLLVGAYGNAIYYLHLTGGIDKIERRYPGIRLQPLKITRLATAYNPSLGIPLIYFLLALLFGYAFTHREAWLSPAPRTAAKPYPGPNPDKAWNAQHRPAAEPAPGEHRDAQKPYDPEQFHRETQQLLASADWPKLLAVSRQWCNLDRSNPDAWLAFGLANYHLAQFSLAQPALETYFRLRPEDNEDALGYLAKTYVKLKKPKPAEKALLKIIALRSQTNPGWTAEDAYYFSELGNIYADLPDRQAEAIKFYQQALDIEPNNPSYQSRSNAMLNKMSPRKGGQFADYQNLAENPPNGINEDSRPKPKNTDNANLSKAAEAGDLASVQRLVENGADINQREMGSFALIQAAKSRHGDVLAYLLRRGAQVHVEDDKGLPAIVYAIANGDKAAIGLLTSAGALRENR